MMTKELFIETLEKIEKQLKYDSKCHDAFSIILPNDYVSGYDYSIILSQLIKILEIEFNDESGWIEYFIWELDCGKNYKDYMITDKNNKNIDMSTIESLYEILMENKSE